MKHMIIKSTLLMSFGLLMGLGANAQEGEAVFKANCSACHKMGMRLVGPDLTGVTDRRSEEWIASFVRNSTGMIADGDEQAVAIFEEFNKMPMTAFALSDGDMAALVTYLGEQGAPAGGDATEEAAPVEVVPFEASADEAAHGMALFQGGASFEGGGPSCIACHNVTNDGVIPGGLLAKDLTKVFSRMGDAGIAGILGAPPFPAMTNAYSGSAALTEDEIHALTAFFVEADAATEQQANSGNMLLMGGGIIGLIIILILVAVIWSGRMKSFVKQDIMDRQLESI